MMEALSYLLTWTMIHSLWLALAIWMIIGLLKSRTSNSDLRRALSLTGLLVYTLSVILFIPVFMEPIKVAPIATGIAIEATASTTWYASITHWIDANSATLSVIWVVGVLLGSVRIIRAHVFLKTYAKTALVCKEDEVLQSFRSLIDKLKIKKRVNLMVSSLIDSPMTTGFIKPTIYLPVGLISGFNHEEIDSLLYHELIHIKRGDYLVNLLLVGLETLFFFNPMVLLMIKELRLEMELVCDDQVTRQYDTPLYINALLKLQELRMTGPVGLAAKNTNSEFKKRMNNMMNKQTNTNRLAPGIVSLLVVIVLCSSTFISRSDQPKNMEMIELQQDTIRFKNREEMSSKIKTMDGDQLLNSVVLVDGEQIKVIKPVDNALHRGEEMMDEIQEELINDGILSDSRPRITLMFQYSDLLNGKEVLDDKYEKYKGIFNRYFPRYDSYATTRVFRYKQ